MKCKICEKEFSEVEEFAEHIREHGVDPDDYLMSYLEPELEEYLKKPPKPRKKTPKKKPKIHYNINSLLDEPSKRAYFKRVKDEYVSWGYPDCETLNDVCFLQVLIFDKFQKIKKQQNQDGLFDVDNEEIRELKSLIESIQKPLEQIKDIYEQTKKEKTVADEIKRIIDESENFIRENIGEFEFKCPDCGTMIDNHGFPHWAYEKKTDDKGRRLYLIWNSQLWELVKGIKVRDKYGKEYVYQIEPYVMALTLETSIEGIIYTAENRKMDVKRYEKDGTFFARIDGVEINIKEQEDKLTDCYEVFKNIYFKRNFRDL